MSGAVTASTDVFLALGFSLDRAISAAVEAVHGHAHDEEGNLVSST